MTLTIKVAAFVLSLLPAGLAAAQALAALPAAQYEGNQCLYANGVSPKKQEGCTGEDTAQLMQLPAIAATIQALSLSNVRIVLSACAVSPFLTQQSGVDARTLWYKISYPLLGYARLQDYIAPITHELAHVFQMKTAGTRAALLAQSSSRKVELGADFLTGVLFKNAQRTEDLAMFQTNLMLVGKYIEKELDAHGWPEQRQAAFRLGYFLPYQAYDRSPDTVYQEFNDNVYGTILARH